MQTPNRCHFIHRSPYFHLLWPRFAYSFVHCYWEQATLSILFVLNEIQIIWFVRLLLLPLLSAVSVCVCDTHANWQNTPWKRLGNYVPVVTLVTARIQASKNWMDEWARFKWLSACVCVYVCAFARNFHASCSKIVCMLCRSQFMAVVVYRFITTTTTTIVFSSTILSQTILHLVSMHSDRHRMPDAFRAYDFPLNRSIALYPFEYFLCIIFPHSVSFLWCISGSPVCGAPNVL